MAWPYSEIWTQPSAATPCLSERLAGIIASLCRAVNERREATAQSATNFYYTDALATATYPTAAQMRAALTQINGPCTKANLAKLQSEVTTMANSGDYYTTTGFTTAWTLSSLLTAVGMGSFATPDNALFSTEWVKLRECLDRLIYFEIILLGSNEADDIDRSNLEGDTDDAWAGQHDNTLSSTTTNHAGWRQEIYSGIWHQVTNYQRFTTTFDTSVYSGSVVHAYMTFQESVVDYSGADTEVDVSGTNVVVDTNGQTDVLDMAGVTSLATDTTITVAIASSEPAGNPFFTLTEGISFLTVDPLTFGGNSKAMDLQINLSSALTDQA